MHRVTAPGQVNGQYAAGNPQTGQRPTQITAADLNVVFNELCSLVIASGQTLNLLDDTQVTTAVLRLTKGRTSLRNALINGDFRRGLWQRFGVAGSALSGAAAYVADRWRSDPGDSGVATINRQTFTSGDLAGAGRAYLRHNQTTPSSATRKPSLVQRIEHCETFAGQTVTLSFWAKTNAGAFQVIPSLKQYFGAASGTPAVTTTGNAIDIGTLWSRKSITLVLPGVPTGALSFGVLDDYLELALTFPAAANFQFDITDVQLELGGLSDFERRPESLETELAARYFAKSYEPETAVGSAVYLGAAMGEETGPNFQSANTRFMVPMRAVPTVVWYSPNSGNSGKVYWNAAEQTVNANNYVSAVATGYPTIAASPANSKAFAQWTADAEL